MIKVEEPSDGVMLISLERPAQRNAIDLEMLDALSSAVARFRDEDKWRCGIVTGSGSAFCAGLDVKAFSAPDAPRHLLTEFVTSLPYLGKPLIAAVNGAAFTGGLELALCCDFIIAAEEARFADTHAKIGALSGSGMGSRLPYTVGVRFAKQMMFTSEPIDAAKALHVGLVNEVVPANALIGRAVEIARLIAMKDTGLVQIVKSVLDKGAEATLGQALTYETEALERRKAVSPMAWTP